MILIPGIIEKPSFLHPSTEMKLVEESAKALHSTSRIVICRRNYDDIFRVIIRRLSTQWCRVLECPRLLVLLSILKNAVFSSNFLLRSEMFLSLASHFSLNCSFVFPKRICLLCLCFRRYFAVYRVVNEIVRLVCFLQVFHCGVFFCMFRLDSQQFVMYVVYFARFFALCVSWSP